MSNIVNPYESPHELGANVATGPSALRFVPAVFSVFFGLIGLCFTGILNLGLFMKSMDSTLGELFWIAFVMCIFGLITATWFGAAWFW